MTRSLILVACVMLSLSTDVRSAAKPNILFIAVDDLRPDLSCYGNKEIRSPNIDRLAARGVVFDRAYCQMAICMASRASLLSGYRPDKGSIWRNGPLYTHVPDARSINTHFQENGYQTVAMGKIYHHSSDYNRGWNKVVKITGDWKGRGYLSEEGMRIAVEYDQKNPKAKRRGMGPAYEGPDVPDNAYGDGKILEAALAEMRRLKGSPFFLATGFKKPHLPFNAPKKYWDLYDPAQIKLASNPYAPKGAPKYAATSWGELRGYHGMPRNGLMPDADARRLIHGYRACVSYVDAQIGRLLDELESLGLADNTVIVLWGDHGWKLGEHGMWCKHTNFELDTHVPLIFVAPNVAARGVHSPALAEFVDIYPTLCELAGLKLPSHLEGTSLVPVLKEPTRSWKKAAISQYPRGNVMGYSLRTARFRYTEWQDRKDGKAVARELYDFERDPACNENLADKPEYAADLARLQKLLRGGWQECRP